MSSAEVERYFVGTGFEVASSREFPFVPNKVEDVSNILQMLIFGDHGKRNVPNSQYLFEGIDNGVGILNAQRRRIMGFHTDAVSPEFASHVLQLLRGEEAVIDPDYERKVASVKYTTSARYMAAMLSGLKDKDFDFFSGVLDTTLGIGKIPMEFIPLFWGGNIAVFNVYRRSIRK